MRNFSLLRSIDGFLLTAVVATAVLGMVELWSLALRTDPPEFATLITQAIALGLGLVVFVFVSAIDWRAWERQWPLLVALLMAALIGVLIFGVRIRGTRGWFAIGGWTVQPVEFAKIGLILLQAIYMRHRARALGHARTVLESAGLMAIVVVPVLLQPDLGSAMILLVTWFGMLLVFGLRRAHLLIFSVTAIVAVALSWQFLLAPYQRERVRTVLDPLRDPQGTGYNQRQALIAVGSGGFFGQGFGSGSQAQLRFLPEAQTDFLPAALAEEFGFVGLAVLIMVIAAILIRLAQIARRCRDDFSAAIVVGLAICYGFQALYNLAMNLGLAPVTGIPIPFVSAGGSAILAFAAGFGIVSSISKSIPRAPLQSSRALLVDTTMP
jgi:rod shape determining protein RodA